MKTLLSTLALLLATSSAGATTFGGSILEILYPSPADTQPVYHAGQKFVGSYRYESDTIDGIFSTPNPPGAPAGATETLDGRLLVPFTSCVTGTVNGEPIEYHDGFGPMVTSLANTPNQGVLTVVGGHVVDFDWSWEVGGFYAHCSETWLLTLNDYDRLDNPPENGALIIFSDPHHVPDGASTAWLLLAGVGLLWRVRRRCAC